MKCPNCGHLMPERERFMRQDIDALKKQAEEDEAGMDFMAKQAEEFRAEIEALKKERDQWEERAEAAWKRLDAEFNVRLKEAIDTAMNGEK